MLNIILCGAPGCGKGTQSELLVEKYSLKHLSTGDLLRAEIKSQSEVGLQAETIIANGNLVPDAMIIDILLKAVDMYSADANGFILDGFPRTVEQAIALEKAFEERNNKISFLIDIQVETNELIERLIKRGETSGRADDNMETIKKRLDIYETKTAPVNDFYKQLGKYHAINGIGAIDEIFSRISVHIDAEIKK
ncbi:MAG: adenylate kinase [Paludibacter sp.]|nr:adenylate kinase [Paludibacter sp.]